MAVAEAGIASQALAAPSRALPAEALRVAARDVTPVLIGVAPFGVAIGVAIAASGIDPVGGWAGSWLVFAGSAHLAGVTLLGAGSAVAAVLTAVVVINLRLAVYSAALAPSLREQPAWFRWVAPYFLVDQLYGLLSNRLAEGVSAAWVRWYYLGCGLALWPVWVAAVAVGVMAGPVLPAESPLGFAAPALLAGLLAPTLVSRPAIVAAACGAGMAIAAHGLPNHLGLLAGAFAGMAVGSWMEQRR